VICDSVVTITVSQVDLNLPLHVKWLQMPEGIYDTGVRSIELLATSPNHLRIESAALLRRPPTSLATVIGEGPQLKIVGLTSKDRSGTVEIYAMGGRTIKAASMWEFATDGSKREAILEWKSGPALKEFEDLLRGARRLGFKEVRYNYRIRILNGSTGVVSESRFQPMTWNQKR
jgi:hypothetical protein